MAIQHPEEEIVREMDENERKAPGDFPEARASSLISGIVLAVKSLSVGGIPGAIYGLFSSMLLNRGTHKVSIENVPGPGNDPWWGRFTKQQAAIAKSRPLVEDPPPPNVTHVD